MVSAGGRPAHSLTDGRMLQLTRKLSSSCASVALGAAELCRLIRSNQSLETFADPSASPTTASAPLPLTAPARERRESADEADLVRWAASTTTSATTPPLAGLLAPQLGALESPPKALSSDVQWSDTAAQSVELGATEGQSDMPAEATDDEQYPSDMLPLLLAEPSESDWKQRWKSFEQQNLAVKYPTMPERIAALKRLCDNPKLTGTSDQLLQRLAKAHASLLRDPQAAIEAFSRFSFRGKAEPIQYYCRTFNFVDRLDAKLALIAASQRETNIHCCMLFYLLRVAVAQCHSDWCEHRWSAQREPASSSASQRGAQWDTPSCAKSFTDFVQEMVASAAKFEEDMCRNVLLQQGRPTRKRPSSSPQLARKLQK